MAAASQFVRIAVGSDHAGYDLKEHIKGYLAKRGYVVDDCGTFDAQRADYPVIAAEVAGRVSDGRCGLGIVVDGAGTGSAMAANKLPGVRAALCYDVTSARNSREHNDANVLTLGARLIGEGLAEQIVEAWLSTECTEERHRRRVAMIGELEGGSRPVGGGTEPGSVNRVQGPSEMRNVECGKRNDARDGAGEGAAKAAAVDSTISLENLSPDDIDRIARRIAELAGPEALRASGICACSCCGPGCNGHCAGTDPGMVRSFMGIGAGRIGHGLGGGPVAGDVASAIDHTLLKPEATASQIEQLCKEAKECGFASVCVNPSFVQQASGLLRGTPVAVCTVAGFPLGAHVPEIKAMEARRSIREGAREIDMVINIGALKGGDDELVYGDIRGVVEACEDGRAICKVILECVLLTDDEKVRACRLCKRARADFVKTSTGFSSGGATAQDVALMAETVRGTGMGVKAAGGIRSYEDLQKMIQAGATRIGASAGVKIIKEAAGRTTAEA